jgi:hypothetical protein
MSTLISTISNTKLKVRWQEPYVSDALNKALSAFGYGVIHGFRLVTQSAQIVRLQRSTTYLQSVASYFDVASGLTVMYVEPDNLDINLASFAGTTVILGLQVTYTTGVATAGEIRAFSQAEYNAAPFSALWFGLINVPSGVTPIAATDIVLWPRSENWIYKQDRAVQGWGENCPDPYMFSNEKWTASTTTGNAVAEFQSVVTNNGPLALRCYLSGGATPGNAYQFVRSIFRAQENDSVLLSFSASSVLLSATQAGARVDWYDSSWTLISSSHLTPSTLTGTTSWTAYNGALRAPANTRFAIALVGATALSAGNLYIDTVRVAVDRQNRFEMGADPFSQVVHTDGIYVRNLKSVLNEMIVGWNETTATEFEMVPNAAGTYALQVGRGTKFVNLNIRGEIDVQGVGTFEDDVSFQTNVEVLGDLTMTGDVAFVSAKTHKKRYTFREHATGGGQQQWGTAGGGISSLGDWITMQLVATSGGIGGTDTGSMRLEGVPKDAIITAISLGVDSTADGSFALDTEIWRMDINSTTKTVVASGAGLTRSGGGSIQRIDWALTPYSPTIDQDVLVLMFQNKGSVAHHFFWVLVEYTVVSFNQALEG